MTVSVNKKGGQRGLMLLTMAAGAVAMLPAATCGADTWDNSSGDAKWSTAANWADDTEPTLADAVTFPTPPRAGSGTSFWHPARTSFPLLSTTSTSSKAPSKLVP
jgi:hypothetical protein